MLEETKPHYLLPESQQHLVSSQSSVNNPGDRALSVMQVHTENRHPSERNFHRQRGSKFSVPNRGSYLAFGCCNLCKQCLGHFSALHFLLNLIINGSINVHGIVLWFPIPLSGNRSCFHLQNILNMTVIFHWPNCVEAFQARHPNWTLLLLLRSR